MKQFRVATDSGCDLPISLCRERGILPLPLQYTIDETPYPDTMEPEDCRTFYQKMRQGQIPHTSQLNPAQFLQFWKQRFAVSDLPIVHICMGSGISGTYQSALTALELLKAELPGAKVFLVDSTLASVGYGMLALEAARLRDEGLSPEDCAAWLEENKSRVNTYYTTGDLTYLYRSGRVSKTGMVIAHALNIWPILKLDKGGHLLVQEKAKGKGRTIKRIRKIIEERCVNPADQTLFICHSDIPEEAKAFGEELKETFGFRDVYYTYIGCTIGTHAGPGLMAAFFFGTPRE